METSFLRMKYSKTFTMRRHFMLQVCYKLNMFQHFYWFKTENCVELGVLRSNLSSIPKHRFERKRGWNGKDYYQVAYTLIGKLSSARFEMSLEFQGKDARDNILDTRN